MNHRDIFDTWVLRTYTNGWHVDRIRVEGDRLRQLGFSPGLQMTRTIDADGALELGVVFTGHTVRGRTHTVSGTAERPVIDLVGPWVRDLMGDRQAVEIEPTFTSIFHRNVVSGLRIVPLA